VTFSAADTQVRAILAAARLRPSEEEIQAAIKGYPALQAALRRLYDLPIDHEEDLALEMRVCLDAQDRPRSAASPSSATDASTSRS
jgi:hypothetical protein